MVVGLQCWQMWHAYDAFINTIMALYDESFPITRVKSDKQVVDKPWITKK